jgi:hypothetical protein
MKMTEIMGIVMLVSVGLPCVAATKIQNKLDYPIKVDLIKVNPFGILKDDMGVDVGPGDVKTLHQTEGPIMAIKEIRVYVDEGTGFPDKPTVSKKRDLYGAVKNIIVSTGPASETGEREYIVQANSNLNPELM